MMPHLVHQRDADLLPHAAAATCIQQVIYTQAACCHIFSTAAAAAIANWLVAASCSAAGACAIQHQFQVLRVLRGSN